MACCDDNDNGLAYRLPGRLHQCFISSNSYNVGLRHIEEPEYRKTGSPALMFGHRMWLLSSDSMMVSHLAVQHSCVLCTAAINPTCFCNNNMTTTVEGLPQVQACPFPHPRETLHNIIRSKVVFHKSCPQHLMTIYCTILSKVVFRKSCRHYSAERC